MISERHVQAIWYDSKLRPKNLRTTDGTPITVIDPGVWNLEAGPDFLNATLHFGTDPTPYTGAIEIHLKPNDWCLHAHATNPAYAQVILHVTWHSGSAPTNLPHSCRSLCIGDYFLSRSNFNPEKIDLTLYPYAQIIPPDHPCAKLYINHADFLIQLLTAAGTQRLLNKAQYLQSLFIQRGDHAQIFYEEMMAAFGYKHNSEPFRALAQRIPWRDLPKGPAAAEAVLSCAAWLEIAPRIPWHTANVRPANSPANRIHAAAALFAGSLPELLIQLNNCDLQNRAGQRQALKLLCASGLLGTCRAAAMLTNVVIPYAIAEGRLPTVPIWIVPEELNSTTRLTAHRLLGRDHNPALYSKNGLCIQGLIQIHHEYCLKIHPNCSTCPLANLNHNSNL